MEHDAAAIALRRCVLAVSVLEDIDLLPCDEGVTTGDVPPVLVTWDELRLAIGDAEPESAAGRARVSSWLQHRRWLAERPHAELRELARPVGLPRGHVLHPGAGWARQTVLGDALDLGLGLAGLDPSRPDDIVIMPTPLLRAADVEPSLWWHDARLYLERMAALAVQRWHRTPTDVLRPMGDCDVITLIGSRTLRAALCQPVGGMRAIVIPMRTRGWVNLSRIDPAFAAAAAAVSEPADRGFERGVLITAEEVVLVQPGGRPQDIGLRDPAVDHPQHLRPVLYHH